ncbi:hypothetical protein Q9299_14895 [Gemmobacter fulvus]|nr:hypothetical protein [Gemmobacter fulvus]
MQALLTAQFDTTAALSALTGEYHRLLQHCAAAAFARQMAESGPSAALAEAEVEEARVAALAEACALRIAELEQRLGAVSRDLATLL